MADVTTLADRQNEAKRQLEDIIASLDKPFLELFRSITGTEPALWLNPDGTASRFFAHNGVIYERE